ncbi:MAG: hypothetical protein RBU25_02305 [Lentisphaeria bacterium]|nr:hypothetical protein [Lentisphaeria bacterium]
MTSLLSLLLAVACSKPEPAAPAQVLVYCTPEAAAHARRLAPLAAGRELILAPLPPGDILAALEGTKAGDFVVFAGGGFAEKLASLQMVRFPALKVHTLGVCLVSAKPTTWDDITKSGLRLGSGTVGGTLDASLPAELREAIAPQVVHRSGRGDELVRLVRLGSLDAALVWDSPPPAPDLPTLALPKAEASCPLHIAALTTSRLPATEAKALLEAWRTAFAAGEAPTE